MRIPEKFCFAVVLLIFFQVLNVNAQIGIVDKDAKTKPVFMLLGSYHMGTQGNNVIKAKTTDITTPERQKEITQLIEKLKKFKPTKIVVEIDFTDDAKTQEGYNQHRAGNYKLTTNETNQIGFRLAKELGHQKVYCVDWGEVTAEDSANYKKITVENAQWSNFLNQAIANWKKEIDTESEKLLNLSIIDQFILINQPARIERDHQNYFDYIRINAGNEYFGANYLSWWYGRNMKILANIIRVTDSPNDKVLVIYGSAHAKLLTQFANESGFYKVESPLKFLQKK